MDDTDRAEAEAPVWDVFLSYASADHERVGVLADAMRTLGLRVFRDREHLQVGETWTTALWNAQRTSRGTVVAVSSHWSEAFWHQDELVRGIELHRKHDHALIPVYLDGIPADLGDVPQGLAIVHSLDARALGSLEAVARAIADRLKPPG